MNSIQMELETNILQQFERFPTFTALFNILQGLPDALCHFIGTIYLILLNFRRF